MLDLINSVLMSIMDPLLGWLLYLPTDVILFIVGIGTSCILVGVRLFTTDQDLLKRCDNDKKRLNILIKEAKKRGDREAVKRHKNTKTMIGLKSIKQEGLPLLAALVPIALLGTWCFNRLAYHPPRENEPVEMIAYFPLSQSGGIVHVIPAEGVKADNGWIREIVPVTDQGPPYGEARWTFRADPREKPYTLTVHYNKETYDKELLVGQNIYAPGIKMYSSGQVTCTELMMRKVKLFGKVPGIGILLPQYWNLFPPWLAAYLLIAVPFVFIVKRVFRIY